MYTAGNGDPTTVVPGTRTTGSSDSHHTPTAHLTADRINDAMTYIAGIPSDDRMFSCFTPVNIII